LGGCSDCTYCKPCQVPDSMQPSHSKQHVLRSMLTQQAMGYTCCCCCAGGVRQHHVFQSPASRGAALANTASKGFTRYTGLIIIIIQEAGPINGACALRPVGLQHWCSGIAVSGGCHNGVLRPPCRMILKQSKQGCWAQQLSNMPGAVICLHYIPLNQEWGTPFRSRLSDLKYRPLTSRAAALVAGGWL
jgi:hypothetical protein